MGSVTRSSLVGAVHRCVLGGCGIRWPELMLYVLSERASCNHVAWGTSYELEEILVRTCDAKVLAPKAWSIHPKLDIGLGKLIPHRYHSLPIQDAGGGTLIAICMGPPSLRMFDALKDWRRRFDRVAAYVIDLYPGAERRLPLSICKQLDALFISYEQMLPAVGSLVSCPVHLVLQAADVFGQGAGGGARPFDLSAYGRQPGELVSRLANRVNRQGSGTIFLHSTSSFPYVSDWRLDRALFWQMLRRTRISICFPFSRTHPSAYRGIDPLTARWFEGIAGGCVLAGRRPTSPEASRALHWEDSVVALPDNEEEAIEAVLALARDVERCESISRRNFQAAAASHDWRHRIAEMFSCLGMASPPRLQEELASLRDRVL